MTTPFANAPHANHASRNGALLACAVIGATLLALLALGHDGRRIVQLAVLAAPGVLWLAWPLRSLRLRRWRSVFTWLWVMGFALDAAVRA